MEGQQDTHLICDGCGNQCHTVKTVNILTNRGFRKISFCDACFHFAKENGMIKNAYLR